MTTQERNNRSILYVLILVLLVFNLGLFYLWQSGKTEKEGLSADKAKLEGSLSEKEKALSAAEQLLEQFRADSAAMADNNLQMSDELNKRKSEIARLTFLLKKNDKNNQMLVDELNSKIAQLSKKLAALEQENSVLRTNNDSLRSVNQGLYSENNKLSAEGRKLKSLAARLSTSEIRVEALKKQLLTRKETNTLKARGVEALRISFNINENNVAEKGERVVFIKITGPEGVTLMNEGQGGVADLADGKSTKYSYKTAVVFENETKQIPATIWKPVKKLTPGKYTVEVFTEGYLMGSTAMDLK
jgi:predicted RNase H-like nuclease (RuvC/YqgF family)